MTRKQVALALLAVVLMCGLTYAVAVAAYVAGFGQASAYGGPSDAVERVGVLRALRRGDTNAAIDLLEAGLDSDIVAFSTFEPEIDRRMSPIADKTDSSFKLMRHVAQYRSEYPTQRSRPEIRSAIQRELKRYPPIVCAPAGEEERSK